MLQVIIGTAIEYAAIHEFGGTIVPKRARYLAIPVGSYTGSPLEHGDLQMRETRGGNLVMVDGAGNVQYVLKTSVTIPARPYLRPAADEHQDEVAREMSEAFQDVIMNAVG